jgi:hypothetical protein
MKKPGLLFLMFFLITPVGALALDTGEEASAIWSESSADDTVRSEVLARNKPKYVCYAYNVQGQSFGAFASSREMARRYAKRNCAMYSKSNCLIEEPDCYQLMGP